METSVSQELYGKIQKVIDSMDSTFFSGKGKEKIPDIVFAINNSCKSCVTAFVSPDSLYNKSNDKKLNYMGINPRYLDRDIGAILATICHELCHVYENTYIHIPRGGYHDKQWEGLMNSCGLEAVYMNKSKTAVSTKIKEGGEFETFVSSFIAENGDNYFNIVEYSQIIEKKTKIALGLVEEDGDGEDGEEDGTPKADNADKPIKKYNRNKIKYTCPSCEAKVWGKAGLHLLCSDCNVSFEEEEAEEKDED